MAGTGWKRWIAVLPLALSFGCLGAGPRRDAPPPFRFHDDTFAYVNELIWRYQFDESGRLLGTARGEPTEFGQRCALMVRTIRQFRVHAVFDPDRPREDRETYADLVDRVVSRSPRRKRPASDPVVIPGYPHLRAFSSDHEDLFKKAIGGPWRSYVQKGNWRMLFPFGRGHQRDTAEELVAELRAGGTPIAHVVRFPVITINHTILIFDAEETSGEIRFQFYDPNEADRPLTLRYDRGLRTFEYPQTPYYGGGPVRVYEIYDGPLL